MQYVWIFKNHKSAKIWGYDSFTMDNNKVRVIWYYGSIGRTMQQLNHKEVIYNHWDAIDTINARTDDKERKGYRRMPNHSYFDAVIDFHIKIEEFIEEMAIPVGG